MRLSGPDRAKVNAGLIAIHDAGHSTDDVIGLAGKLIDMGTPPDRAYQRAFAGFCEAQPNFRATFQRIEQVVDAADLRTLAQYNVALDRYVEGDATALDAVAPLADQACIALAEQTGDAGFLEGVGGYTSPEPQAAAAEAVTAAPAPPRPGHGPTGYRRAEAAERQPYKGPTGVVRIGPPETYGPGPSPAPVTE